MGLSSQIIFRNSFSWLIRLAPKGQIVKCTRIALLSGHMNVACSEYAQIGSNSCTRILSNGLHYSTKILQRGKLSTSVEMVHDGEKKDQECKLTEILHRMTLMGRGEYIIRSQARNSRQE